MGYLVAQLIKLIRSSDRIIATLIRRNVILVPFRNFN